MKTILLITIGISSLLIFTSCTTQKPFEARTEVSPSVEYCNDAIGHIEGNKPYSMGGKCTCTPDRDHYVILKEEGSIKSDMSYDAYKNTYDSKSIVTDLDHKGCNNMCEFGPHVVFGGSCMATPTPGTLNYERVISGDKMLTIFQLNPKYSQDVSKK